MSRHSSAPVRRRRAGASILAAAALALAGLVAVASPASADAPTVTISPTTAAPSTNIAFTVTVSATATSSAAQTISITVPSGFTSPHLDSLTSPDGVWSTSGPTGGVYTFSAPTSNNKLNGSETLVAVISAVTPSVAGPYTWTTSGTTNGTTAIAGFNSPVVTVGSVKQNQTITFAAIGNQVYGTGPLTLGATASSGLTVSYTTSGNCSAVGNQLTLGNVGSCSVTAHQAGNSSYNAATDVTRSFNIVPADQTINFPAITPPHYGDAPLTLSATATSGLTVTFSSSTTAVCTVSGTTLTIVAAGSCTVTADQAGNSNYNAAPSVPQTFSVLKATATLDLSDLNYTYDGSPHGATITTTPAGLDTVTITYDDSTTEPTAAGSYAVHASLDNPNYEGSVDGTLVIAQKHVTGTFTVADKDYDGTTAAAITGCSVSGIESVDSGNVDIDCSSATAAFDGADAGSHNATLTGAVLTGTGSENYVLDGVDPTSGTINQATVTAHLQAGDKVYDGTDDATGYVTVTLTGVVSGEESLVDTAVDSATFADRNVGTKTVTVTVHLTGTGAGNYVLASTTLTDTATINALHITGTFTASDKVYDGTTAASVTNRSLVGVIVIAGTPDDVSLSGGTATFSDRNVGPGKTVTLTGATLAGTDAGNYVLDSVATTTASITAKPLTGSFTAADKQYDGTTAATIVTRSLTGVVVIAGVPDDVSLVGGTATFSDALVGTNKTVTATGFTLSGADAGNYTLNAGPWTTTASITPLYRGSGFYQPVDMPNPAIVWNTIKGGQTVPLKFEIFNATTGVEQTSLSVFGSDPTKAFSVQSVACGTGSAPSDAIEEVITSTGGTALRYDTSGGQYIQNWKTPTTVGSCYAVWVKTVDGSKVGPAYFKITK